MDNYKPLFFINFQRNVSSINCAVISRIDGLIILDIDYQVEDKQLLNLREQLKLRLEKQKLLREKIKLEENLLKIEKSKILKEKTKLEEDLLKLQEKRAEVIKAIIKSGGKIIW